MSVGLRFFSNLGIKLNQTRLATQLVFSVEDTPDNSEKTNNFVENGGKIFSRLGRSINHTGEVCGKIKKLNLETHIVRTNVQVIIFWHQW